MVGARDARGRIVKRLLTLVTVAVTLVAGAGVAGATTMPPPAGTGLPTATADVDGPAQTVNWAGYVAQSPVGFTEVVGSWVQPTVSCLPVAVTAAAFWVGLDGYGNRTVEQIGTKATCSSGSPTDVAWWQMYPAPKVVLDPSTYPVAPGDILWGKVVRSGTAYTLTLRSSEGWSYSTSQVGDGANATAEWIASSPPLCPTCRFAELADFGSVWFAGAQAAAGGGLRPIASWTSKGGPDDVTMVSAAGVTRAVPGPLRPDGDGFAVTWAHV
jgi:hypothetical protein